MKEGGGGCRGPRDPPEGLSMPSLEPLHAIDITVVMHTVEGTFLLNNHYKDIMGYIHNGGGCLPLRLLLFCPKGEREK